MAPHEPEAEHIEATLDAGEVMAEATVVPSLAPRVLEEEEVLGPAEAEGAEEVIEEEGRAEEVETTNNLSVYFREMSQMSVLKPEQEYEIAHRIGDLELSLWVKLLAYAPVTAHIVWAVEQEMENGLPELKAVRRAAERALAAGHHTDEELTKLAGVAAEQMQKLDIDRIYVGAAMVTVHAIATGESRDPLPVRRNPKVLQRYARDLDHTVAAIQRAKNEFVNANLRLVVSIARRFNHGRLPLADLIQEGNIGLMKAVERFDYRRGYRFSTYASWWIRHAISRGIADKGRAVRLPVHMIDVYHRVARSKRELSGKLGRQPTTEEIGAATGLAVNKIEKMRSYLVDQGLSLDRAVSEKDGRRFIDFIQDESERSFPTERLVSAALSTEVRRVLSDLKPIEADILRQRFGLDTDQELTLKQIGEKYNLSRERIRQLQEQALQKVRRALVRRDMV